MTALSVSLTPGVVPPEVAQLVAFMEVFEMVFHPMWFAVATGLTLVVYEWYRTDGDLAGLRDRLAALGGIVTVGASPAIGYVLFSGASFDRAFTDPPWQIDVASAIGVLLTAGLIWVVWRHFDWGQILPGGTTVIVATMLPYVAIAPFWNISGHVTFTTAQALYLTVVDRRFAPVLLVPLVTLFNRPILNAHTWLQSIAGLLLALVVGTAVVVFVLDDRTASFTRARPATEEA